MVAGKLADMKSANLYDLAVVLGVSPEEARPTWGQLISEGFIETTPDGAQPTERMDDLARARFGKPLPRKRADALVEKAVSAAKALNALPPDAPYYWITRLVVFGSYLDSEKPELGDLDLAWEVEGRPGVMGHVMMSIMYNRDDLQSTRAQVIPKGPYVRLTSLHAVLDLKCPYQVIYTFTSEELTKAREDRAAELKEFFHGRG
jgi:predicted nucleotidyltransferase